MKTKSIFLSLVLATTAFTLSNCSGKKEHEAHENAENTSPTEVETAKPQFEVDKLFQQQLAQVFNAYVELKNSLVSSDAAKVKDKAADTRETLSGVDMTLISGAAHNDWMAYLTQMESALKEIQSSEDIEVQRKAFGTLSDNLYKSIKAFGLGDEDAFYTYCPMAFDNQGAYWLSESDQVRNPYFGDKMLKCGEVKEKL